MKLKQKDKQVLTSIDKLSHEMAEHAIKNNKDKLIEEINADILKSDKSRKVKPKPSFNTFIFFSSDSSEQKDNNSQNSNVNGDKNNDKSKEDNNKSKKNNASQIKNLIFIRDRNNPENIPTKKAKKVSFAIDNKKKTFEEMNNINEIKENINNNSNKNNNTNTFIRNNRNTNDKTINNNRKNNDINYDENEFIDGNKIIIKNDKEDLEITLSPIYGSKGNDDEINYYKIKSYIDKNKKKLQKKLQKKYKGDNTYNTNLTATFGDKNAINRNKTNSNLLKSNEKEDKDEALINKSFTDRNKRISSLQNNNTYSSFSSKWKSSKKNVLNQRNGYTKSIDNISENDYKKFSRESSNSIDYSSKLNSSSSILNSSHDFSFTTSSNNINKNNNNLIVNYCKNRRNSKYKNFLEKQLKRQRLAQLKINKMKRDKELKEFKNYYSSPKLNSLSLQIVNSKGNYIPLFKRAIEIENEKKMKRLINQKIQNNNFIINNSINTKRTAKQINDFFYAQMSWRDRVDQKNKYLKKLLIEQKNEENSEISNYELKINPKSELILLQKRQNNLSLIDITQSNSTIISNSANRLYKDYEIRQKKLKKLKRELTPSFMPSINKSPKIYNYKNKKKNYRINANEQIKEVNVKDYDSSYKYKYHSYNQRINSKNSSKAIKSQKSRNPKGITNNLVSSRFFNKKENNLKSTAVDSRNTKSAQKVSSISNTKLEKINENDISNEYSHPNSNSTNKNIEIKNNKTNFHTTLNNLNNNSKNEENKKNEFNTKKSDTKKTNSKISQSKESKSEESNTENSHNVTESEKESKNTKKEFLKSKEINTFNINEEIKDNRDNKDNKDENNKENENNEKEEEKEMKTNKEINKRLSARAITTRLKGKTEKKNPFKTFRRVNSISNISPNIPGEINNKSQIKKSINEVKINKNNLVKSPIKVPFSRHKSVITKKSSELLLTNKYKDKLTPHLGNSIENQNDTIEINNIDKGNYNLFNDFFTNKSNSKVKNNNNIIKSSLYNDVDEIHVQSQKDDDFFDENFKSNISSEKKSEKKIVVKYRFDCTDDDENEEDEENEDGEEGGNKSISWIKKLKEISKNEEIKTDRDKDGMNKKKKGASTTRSQTKRKTIDKEKDNINKNSVQNDEEKLYMLNLRNSSATGKLNPYTVTAKEQIFYKFFLKK